MVIDLGIPGLPIRKVSETSFRLNTLIYGKSGVGKTALAASAWEVPELHPILYLDVEKGSNTFRDKYPDMEVLRLDNWTKIKQVNDRLARNDHGVETVILDNISEASELNMGHIMTRRIATKRSDEEFELASPEHKEYFLNKNHLLELIRTIRDADCNVIFTAWRRTDEDKKTGVTHIRPDLLPKVSDTVPGLLDEVFYYYIKEANREERDNGEEDARILLTSNTVNAIAKDRSGKLPKRIKNPTMEYIYKTIRGESVNV